MASDRIFRILTIITLVVLSIAVYLSAPVTEVLMFKRAAALFSTSTSTSIPPASATRSTTMTGKTPVYFFSHGGPSVMYEKEHPVYAVLQGIGKEITEQVKPKAVVVFSGHWEGSRDTIEVNTAAITDLIYDFYGFPAHYYKAQYPNVGNPELANKILGLLGQAGIKAKGVTRGLDHGVWAGFHVAFHPDENPLNVPLVQVSLYHTEDPDQHYRLGQAVASLREEGVVIIGAGMSVHNLRDMWASMGKPTPMPYTVSFDEALKDATEAPVAVRQERMAEAARRPDAKQAHPWMDHLMPVYVAAGAAGTDLGKRTWTLHEGSMGWAQYRFGNVTTS